MDFPIEVVLLVLKSLHKSDLKSARLVSKNWTALAAERLFDQIYVSAHPDNLDVFRAITRHPLLSKWVRTLRYDAVNFVETLTKALYFQDLWRQTRVEYTHLQRKNAFEAFEVLTPDTEINTWLKLVAPHVLSSSQETGHYLVVWRKCKDFRFINRGFHKYKYYAALQDAQLNGEDFFENFVEGLQNLRNLTRVKVEDRWPVLSGITNDSEKLFLKSPTGSPMARNWESFHARPRRWQWMPPHYNLDSILGNGATDGAVHYWTMTNALIRSERKIQSFQIGHGWANAIPPYIFDRSQPNSLSSHGLDIVAFSGLKILKLRIAAYGDEKTPEYFPNMDGLRFLLGSLRHLEVLNLDLPAVPEDQQVFYNYNEVFPPECQWNQLETLSLQNLASDAADFLALLIQRAPNLNDLELGTIELLSGTWEGVIECMMQSMHLSSSYFAPYTQFLHRGGTEFPATKDLNHSLWEIEEYVETGGRHPCLRSDQPNSAAQDYVTEDLKPFYKARSSA